MLKSRDFFNLAILSKLLIAQSRDYPRKLVSLSEIGCGLLGRDHSDRHRGAVNYALNINWNPTCSYRVMAFDAERVGHHAPANLPPDSVLFGNSAVMQELKRRLSRICLTSVPVLLQGEVGVGKGVLSRFIHQNLAAAPGNYLRFNCASLSGGWGLFALSAAMQGNSDADRAGWPGHECRKLIHGVP